MTLKKIKLSNIAVFVNFNLELSDGINIIIGENGSGKTIFLKSIYDTCHDKKQDVLDNKYIRKHNDNTDCVPNIFIEYQMENGKIESCWLMENGQKLCVNETNDVLYIPVMEMLSHSKGLISLYEKYDLPLKMSKLISYKTHNCQKLENRQILKKNFWTLSVMLSAEKLCMKMKNF